MSEIMRTSSGRQKLGKRWGSSKMRYTWEFQINEMGHQLVFVDSKQSKKVRIFLNGRQIYEATRQAKDKFSFTVEIQGCRACVQKEASDSVYGLTLNEQPFKELKLSEIDATKSSEDFTLMRSKNSYVVLASRDSPFATNDRPLSTTDNPYSISMPVQFSRGDMGNFGNEYIKVYDVGEPNDDPYYITVVNTYNWKNEYKPPSN